MLSFKGKMICSARSWSKTCAAADACRNSSRNITQLTQRPIQRRSLTQLLQSSSSLHRPSPANVYNNLRSKATALSRPLSSSAPHRAASRYVRFEYDPSDPLNPRKWDWGSRALAIIVGGGLLFYVYNLEYMEETGRYRFMVIGKSLENRFSDEFYENLLQEYKGRILPPDHPLSRHVRRVAGSIIEASNLGHIRGTSAIPTSVFTSSRQPSRQPTSRSSLDGSMPDDIWDPDAEKPDMRGDWGVNAGTLGSGPYEGQSSYDEKSKEWNVMVVDDKNIANAFAAFRNIVVFTGILPVCKDEEGLAAVLGHEIGHVVARHNAEKISSSIVLVVLGALLTISGLPVDLSQFITSFALELPNSRMQEYEADQLGLNLTARACYDPGAAPRMFQRLGELDKKSGRLNVDFLYTHPTSANRVKRLNEKLPEAYSVQAQSTCGNTADNFNAFQRMIGRV